MTVVKPKPSKYTSQPKGVVKPKPNQFLNYFRQSSENPSNVVFNKYVLLKDELLKLRSGRDPSYCKFG